MSDEVKLQGDTLETPPATEGVGGGVPAIARPTHFRGVPLLPAELWKNPDTEGVFFGVSNADYHADRGSLSSSGVKKLIVSPADFRAADKPDEKKQSAFDIGTLAHAFVLENASLESLGYTVQPDDFDGRTAAGKAWAARQKELNLRPVAQDAVGMARELEAAVYADRYARAIASRRGLAELSLRVRDPKTGVMLRARPDYAPHEGAWMWDLKTTRDATPVVFRKEIFDLHYDISAAHYVHVARLLGLRYGGMVFVAVAKEGAHAVSLHKFGPTEPCEEDWRLATRLCEQAYGDFKQANATGVWSKPEYAPSFACAAPWQRTTRAALLRDAEIPY